jgi:hypothetical protein
MVPTPIQYVISAFVRVFQSISAVMFVLEGMCFGLNCDPASKYCAAGFISRYDVVLVDILVKSIERFC